MKLSILYHNSDENTTRIEDFSDECKKRTSNEVNLFAIETEEGAALAAVYDVVDYPAILVLRDDGQLNKGWQGSQFPAIEEVVGYLNN